MFFKKFDYLSPLITLYRNEKLRHTSIFSGILTIISYLTLIIIGFYFLLDIIEMKNPTAYYFNRFTENAGFYPINSSSLFSYIQVLDTETSVADPIDFDSIRIIGAQRGVDSYLENHNLLNYNHWVYGNCNNDSDIKGIEDISYYQRFINSACIRKYFNKNEQKYYNTNEKGFIWPSVDKGCSHPEGTFYAVIIEQCRNDSLKKNCKPQNKINYYITRHSINFQFIDHYTDVYNFHQPFKKYFSSVFNRLYVGSYTVNNMNFNPIVLKTHKGIIFDEQEEKISYLFEQNEKITNTWENDDSGIYTAFYFWMQNRMQYYERSYKKLVDILATIGGLNNCILFIVGIINKVVNKYITILDTQDLIIDLDRKMGNKINYKNKFDSLKIWPNGHNNKNNNQNDIISALGFRNKENTINKNIINKNIINTNDKSIKYSYSMGTKNVLTNNLLLQNNNKILNVINKDRKYNSQNIIPVNEKNKEYKSIKKISLDFLEYLGYKICKIKRNKILIYESFREKIISEEQFIQNFIDIYKLLSIYVNKDNEVKLGDKFNLSLLISSIV